jgi:hypothetical protein
MSRYEERLDAFVRGRRFARMSRPVRNRADSWCDACGSVQARVLFGVQEEVSKAVYFVGEHCLQELAARGAIVRRFLRLSAEEAYAARCEGRADATPEIAEGTLAADSPGQADEPESLLAYLILATPGRRQAPLVLPLDVGATRQALDSLGDAPGLRRQLRDLGLGGMPSGVAPGGNEAKPAKASGPRKTKATRRAPLVMPPESPSGAA